MRLKLTDHVSTLKGVGEKTEKQLQKMGIVTIEDLLNWYPRAYVRYEDAIDVSEVVPERRQAVIGTLTRTPARIPGGRVDKTTAVLMDMDKKLHLMWYRMPYIRRQLSPGKRYVFYGQVKLNKGQMIMEQPEVFEPAAYKSLCQTIQPVYSLTQGVGQKLIAKLVRQVFENECDLDEFLPQEITSRIQLLSYEKALYGVHFPDDDAMLQAARRRLGFDEFFLFALAVRRMKVSGAQALNCHPMHHFSMSNELIDALPYQLTGAQMHAWQEIQKDLGAERNMNRLLQGDVGSGKTIIAELALLAACEEGLQSCLMAPTEVLAKQHYEGISKDFEKLTKPDGTSIKVGLLVGSMKASEKKKVYKMLLAHEIDVLIGTHAVIQEKVVFKDLALVITDEQHRFGVNQREWLADKGVRPHVLVMSATPIPRTLAIILYGDLDISVINELPASRLPIKNCVVNTSYRPNAYRFIEQQVRMGHQVYVICPMVEESEFMDTENVLDYTEKLKQALSPDIHIAYLHGRMKGEEKNEIMTAYQQHEIDVLVSTTVIEVGINVPNATVMMVENAERFGLAQLHQLRGRVGRGNAQSYCIFIQSKKGDTSKQRLETLVKSNDGFYIASEDLKLRGPGDFFGIRQSGLVDFKVADLYHDTDLLKLAGECAALYEEEMPASLADRVERYMTGYSDYEVVL